MFMFSGMKWGSVSVEETERERDRLPCLDDSTTFILHATADKALVPADRDHKSPPRDAVPTAYTIPDDKHTIIHTTQGFSFFSFFPPLSPHLLSKLGP